ncbi:hypothetical protein [Helicobacter pylori]|nr:hypothetical protein [Helicobacter pylori]
MGISKKKKIKPPKKESLKRKALKERLQKSLKKSLKKEKALKEIP